MKLFFLSLFILISASPGAESFPYPTSSLAGSEDLSLNFVQISQRESTLGHAKKKNQSVLSKLQRRKTDQALSRAQAVSLRDFLISHPIGGDIAVQKYSQQDHTLGFCYGRATLAHMELLRRGVHPQNIRKIFVIGEMRYQKDIWELHVATLVSKKGGGWWVLDGLFEQVYELKDWYQKILSIAINTKNPVIRLYDSDPVKFLPISGAYNEKDMYRPEYKGFFKDLSAWLIASPVKKEDLFFAESSHP